MPLKFFSRSAPAPRKAATDRDRWTNGSSFRDTWESRSAFAAALCADSSVVCDIGCGKQTLRTLLADTARYLPADLTQWTPDTAVCDLNANVFPDDYLRAADTTTLLGVIEYLDDFPRVLEVLGGYDVKLVATYNPSDLSDLDRAGHGWVNDYRLCDLVVVLKKGSFSLRSLQLFQPGQVIFSATHA